MPWRRVRSPRLADAALAKTSNTASDAASAPGMRVRVEDLNV
jgi:hypothetical protein